MRRSGVRLIVVTVNMRKGGARVSVFEDVDGLIAVAELEVSCGEIAVVDTRVEGEKLAAIAGDGVVGGGGENDDGAVTAALVAAVGIPGVVTAERRGFGPGGFGEVGRHLRWQRAGGAVAGRPVAARMGAGLEGGGEGAEVVFDGGDARVDQELAGQGNREGEDDADEREDEGSCKQGEAGLRVWRTPRESVTGAVALSPRGRRGGSGTARVHRSGKGKSGGAVETAEDREMRGDDQRNEKGGEQAEGELGERVEIARAGESGANAGGDNEQDVDDTEDVPVVDRAAAGGFGKWIQSDDEGEERDGDVADAGGEREALRQDAALTENQKVDADEPDDVEEDDRAEIEGVDPGAQRSDAAVGEDEENREAEDGGGNPERRELGERAGVADVDCGGEPDPENEANHQGGGHGVRWFCGEKGEVTRRKGVFAGFAGYVAG